MNSNNRNIEGQNPESIMMPQMEGHWQKMCAVLLWKLAKTSTIRITNLDLQDLIMEFEPGMPVVFTNGKEEYIEFALITEEQAKARVEFEQTKPLGLIRP